MQTAMRKARESLVAELREGGLLRSRGVIAGEWLPAASGKVFAVLDPATGHEVEHVSASGAEYAERAVGAASESFASWRGNPVHVSNVQYDSFARVMVGKQKNLLEPPWIAASFYECIC